MKISYSICLFAFLSAAYAQTCTYTVSPDTLEFERTESEKGVKVTLSAANCPWTVTIDVPWLSAPARTQNNLEGSVLFRALANPGAARTAVVMVAGKPVNIRQAGGATSTTPTIRTNGVVHAATYDFGSVAPGEIVSIFGDNLGPDTIVTMTFDANGKLSSALGGTRVLFDGQPAPMVFSLKSQVSAIVPYAVGSKTITDVQVEYNGVVTDRVSMPVAVAIPGLFSLDASGKGAGAIRNQDFSVNSASNPAYPGDVIMLYGTGEGLTEPQLSDGQRIPSVEPLPRPKLPVAATVGGKPAGVTYAGGAPTFPAGAFQMNVKLPDDVAVGDAVPVAIMVGAASSPAVVTVAIQHRH